jgi:hypothetical protein
VVDVKKHFDEKLEFRVYVDAAVFYLHPFYVSVINLMFYFSFQWHIPANNTLKKESARYRFPRAS